MIVTRIRKETYLYGPIEPNVYKSNDVKTEMPKGFNDPVDWTLKFDQLESQWNNRQQSVSEEWKDVKKEWDETKTMCTNQLEQWKQEWKRMTDEWEQRKTLWHQQMKWETLHLLNPVPCETKIVHFDKPLDVEEVKEQPISTINEFQPPIVESKFIEPMVESKTMEPIMENPEPMESKEEMEQKSIEPEFIEARVENDPKQFNVQPFPTLHPRVVSGFTGGMMLIFFIKLIQNSFSWFTT